VVSTLTNDNTSLSYTFSSTEGGTFTIGGGCSSDSDNDTVVADNMTVSFAALADGTYGGCYIEVTDSAGNKVRKYVNQFTIDTIAPTLAQVIAVTTPTNDNSTLSYTFSSTEAGTITYGGSCSSGDNTSVGGPDNAPANNAITFNALADATYIYCKISVTDNATNTSDNLTVSSFTIDTVKPVLAVVTAVKTPTNDTTPEYSFRSTEAGTNSYGGLCGSSSTSATIDQTRDNVTIILTQSDNSTALSDNTSYSCTITITDSAGNTSDALHVNTFVVDITAPTVASTSPTDNLTSSVSVSDNISVTFSESMDNTSVTTNTSNTTCPGYSFQVSSDSFSTCVQMGSSPSSSDNLTFTVTPSLKMFYSATYKIRVTDAAKDSAGNNIDNHTQTYGFKTTITIPITAGSAHSCFMLDNGSVKCWGENSYGQLGLGYTINRGDNSSEMGDNLNSVDLGNERTATAIAAGKHHTCAILDNASVKCWGSNASGQLGLGDADNRGDGSASGGMGDSLPAVELGSGRTAKAIAAGNQHTCAILDNSSVKCWGANASGQLGLGNTSNRGDNSNEMGDYLPTVDLGPGRTAKVIATGGSHTCAVLDNASVKCWGENSNSQLGLGDHVNRGDEPDEMGNLLPSVELYSDTATSITTGTGYTCVLLNDNSTDPLSNVKCWGRGNQGQLGNKKKEPRTTPAVNAINLGTGITGVTTARKATAITAGNFHTCAILDNSSIKCWGFNASGQLGQGNIDTVWSVNHLGDALPAVDLGAGRTARGIAAGDNHTCVVLDNTSVKCWGKNESGQLGLGNTSNRGDNSSEMGDNLPVIGL
jgi:alpha-tubulin suppressor-like RCC1 family protein